MTKNLATTPIPVQLSGPEFTAFIFPHLSTPRRGPKCKLGYHRVFNLILWVLANVRHLTEQNQVDLNILHGDAWPYLPILGYWRVTRPVQPQPID